MKKLLLTMILPLLAVGFFTSCDDVPSPYYVLSPEEVDMTMKGEGKSDKPYTVGDALKIISAGTYSSSNVYVEGIVVQIDDIDADQFSRYHNLTYYIADENDIDEEGVARQQLEIYRGLGLAGANFNSPSDLKVGDHVIVWGQLTLYGSTAEVTQGSWLLQLNDQKCSPFDSQTEPAGSGTYEDPYNVSAANSFIDKGDYTGKKVFVKGIVSRVDDIDDDQFNRFHNLTYYISDDGISAGQLEVYRGKGLGGADFAKKDDLKVGDEVIVYGELTLYGSTKEFKQDSQLAYLNGQESKPSDPTSGEATGDGTKDNPYNSVAANQLANSLADNASSGVVYIKGKVSNIKQNYNYVNDKGQSFGNATFYISDDGSANGQFYIYRALYLGNKVYDGNGDLLKEGDDVVICGKITKYVGQNGGNPTLETVQNEAYLYSLNGKVEEGGNNDPTGEATGDGTLQNPYNSVAAIQVCNALDADAKTDKDVYVKGKVVSIKENYNVTDKDGKPYGNITCYISDDGTTTNQFQIYRALYFGNQPWTEGVMPKVGDDVVFCGKLMNFRGTTPETSQKEAYLYSLNGQTGEGGSPTPGEDTQTDLQGDGTQNSPYTVADALQVYEKGGGTAVNAFVTGYVVGYVNGNSYNGNTVTFGYPEKADTEIVIADSPNETDYTKCIPVQLPKEGKWRSDLELYAQQALMHQQVVIKGSIEKYFGVCGIKSPTYASWGDTVIGTPEAKKR